METMQTFRASSMTLRFARRVGVSLVELAHTAGIARERLESGAPLTYDEGVLLWSALEKLTGDPVVGLTAGRQFTLDQMGALGPAFAAAPTLREGLMRLVPLLRLILHGASIELIEPCLERAPPDAAPAQPTDEHAALGGIEYRMPSVHGPHGVDAMFAAIVSLARQCTGHHVCPRVVDLQAPWRSDLEVHTSYFGVRPTWARPTCRILFDASDLNRSFEGADPALSQVLLDNAERLLRAEAAPAPAALELETAIIAAADGGNASVDEVAIRLNTSVRTLQRRVAKSGRTFAEVRAEVLLRRARDLLREGLAVAEVAARSGYTTRAGFERAFTRWSGQSPATYRAAARSGS